MALMPTTTNDNITEYQEHNSMLFQPGLARVCDVAETFPDRDTAIAHLLHQAARLEYLENCGIPPGESCVWTNYDLKRACERLSRHLEGIASSVPPTRW